MFLDSRILLCLRQVFSFLKLKTIHTSPQCRRRGCEMLPYVSPDFQMSETKGGNRKVPESGVYQPHEINTVNP